MKTLFLDTNIILDFLGNREPHSRSAAALFSLAEDKKIALHVSAISFNNIYFLLRRSKSHKASIGLLKELSKLVQTVDLDGELIQEAYDLKFNDLEDAIQELSARSVKGVLALVTRNTKDFKNSQLPIMNAELALALVR